MPKEWNSGIDAEEHVLVLKRGVLDRGVDVALEVAVGQQHALGQPAGAAGVHQHRHVVGIGRGHARRRVACAARASAQAASGR